MNTRQRWAIAAAVWCVAFGLLSLLWAIGFDILVNKLGPGLQTEAANREPGFVAILWGTSVAKLLGAAVPILVAFGTHLHRLMTFLTWSGGILLTVYGLIDIIVGSWRALEGQGDNAYWYAVLWGPIWLLGGVTFLGTALSKPPEPAP